MVFLGCKKEDEVAVHPELRPHFESFKEEAATRGITVDFEKRPIGGELISDPERSELGWCDTENGTDQIVRINVLFWPVLTPLNQEKLVYHELGHCFLRRAHLDEKNMQGRCLSIMHSGQVCSDNYSLDTREQYLDELFLQIRRSQP